MASPSVPAPSDSPPQRGRGRQRGSRAQYEEWKLERKAEDAKKKKRGLSNAREKGLSTSKKAGKAVARPWKVLLRSFWSLIRSDRATLVASLVLLTVSTGIALITPASTKIVIDYVFTDKPGPTGLPAWLGLPTERVPLLWAIAGILLALTLLETAVRIWGRYLMTRIRRRMQVTLRRDTFRHAMRLPLGRVFELKSGGVASLLRTDAGGAADLLLNLIWSPWRAVIRLVGTLAVLALVDLSFLVGASVFLVVVFFSHRGFIGRIRSLWRDIRKTRSGIDGHATEAFGGMRVVRTFRRQRSEARRFVEGNALVARQEMRAWWLSRVIELVWSLLVPVSTTLVLLYGGLRVIEGTLTIGDVMMFTTYLALLLAPVEQLVSNATSIQNNLAALDRVLDLLEEPLEFADQQERTRLEADDVKGHYRLDNVWFQYGKDAKGVLSGVTLEIEAGQSVALVGPSGAGKTTMLQLLARFYDPDQGAVYFDGKDLKTVDVDTYRAQLAIVDQDLFLFDGPLRDNIAYARPEATDDEVIAAAKLAAAHTFIMEFPDGYDTAVGERGVKLSGGQRQRIAIARAALANPRVLLLDEATSHLDSQSEEQVQEGLRALSKGRTTFVIAHRLSTVRDADRILVLDEGKVVEDGTHDELVAKEGRYFELLQAQL